MSTEDLRDNFLDSYKKDAFVRERGTNFPHICVREILAMATGRLYRFSQTQQNVRKGARSEKIFRRLVLHHPSLKIPFRLGDHTIIPQSKSRKQIDATPTQMSQFKPVFLYIYDPTARETRSKTKTFIILADLTTKCKRGKNKSKKIELKDRVSGTNLVK